MGSPDSKTAADPRRDPPPLKLMQHAVRCGCLSGELVPLKFVLDVFADLLGVRLDLVGLAFGPQAVIVCGVACSFLRFAAEVFCFVTDLVSEAHGGAAFRFGDQTMPFHHNTKLAYYFKPGGWNPARLEAMEHSTTLTQHIQASPESVWAVITDIPASAATLSGVESVQLLTDGPYGEGTRWRETRKMLGRSETVEMWVASVEPGRSTVVKALQGGADYTTRFSLSPRDGGTDLTLTFGAEIIKPTAASRILMALFGKLGMSVTRKALAKDLADIAAKAESA